MLNSKRVSERLGISERHVRNITKKALDSGLSVITCKGERFTFELTSTANTHGKAYFYAPITIPTVQKPKRRVPNSSVVNPAEVPKLANLQKPTTDEKIRLVGFCNTSGLSVSDVAKALIIKHDEMLNIKQSSLAAKLKRWRKAFKNKGRAGLEDKRGGKEFKADLELVKHALYGTGSEHKTSAYMFYCCVYAEKHGLKIDLKNPKADISESAFYRTAKYLLETDALLRDFMRIGMDAFVYAEPSFGRKFDYPNQQWEIDATPLDIMVKVPHTDGIRDFTNKEPSEDYHLVRPQLIGVIDNFTGATVYGLYESSNSYSNARLLYKAISILGMSEAIKGDNGADYVSVHMQTILEKLGIDYIATGKGRGDQKGKIERSFRTLQHSPEFESLAGFIGHNVEQRQKLEAQSSTKLEKLSGVATNIKGEYLWWWEMENWIDNYISHKQSDKYAKHTPANDEILEVTYRTLGKRTVKKVSSTGIRHRNTDYLSPQMWERIKIGDDVEIVENIDDVSKLYLYKNDQYIGEIQGKEEVQKGLSVEEVKANKKAYKQRVVKDAKAAAKKAQRNYSGLQNHMRDEYLSIEAQNNQAKREQQKQKEKDGFDSLAEMRRRALRVVND